MRLKVLFVILVFICLTGCWDREELRNLAEVDSVVYDLSENDNVKITAEIVNPSGMPAGNQGGGNKIESPTIIITEEARTIPEAFKRMSYINERRIYYAHTKVRFITEAYAKHRLYDFFDFFTRDYELRQNAFVVVLKGFDGSQLYQATIGSSGKVGDYVLGLKKIQNRMSSSGIFVESLEFIKDYFKEGKQPVAGVVELIENRDKAEKGESSGNDESQKKEEYRLQYKGLAAFKDTSLVGFFDENETRAYNIITNNAKSSFLSVPIGTDLTVLEIIESKSKIKVSLKEKKAAVDINVKMRVRLTLETGTKNVESLEVQSKIEDAFNEMLKKELEDAVKKAQTEFKSDIFGFGVYAHIQNPTEFNKVKKEWDDIFSNAKVTISLDSNVYRTGETEHPFKMEEK